MSFFVININTLSINRDFIHFCNGIECSFLANNIVLSQNEDHYGMFYQGFNGRTFSASRTQK